MPGEDLPDPLSMPPPYYSRLVPSEYQFLSPRLLSPQRADGEGAEKCQMGPVSGPPFPPCHQCLFLEGSPLQCSSNFLESTKQNQGPWELQAPPKSDLEVVVRGLKVTAVFTLLEATSGPYKVAVPSQVPYQKQNLTFKLCGVGDLPYDTHCPSLPS